MLFYDYRTTFINYAVFGCERITTSLLYSIMAGVRFRNSRVENSRISSSSVSSTAKMSVSDNPSSEWNTVKCRTVIMEALRAE